MAVKKKVNIKEQILKLLELKSEIKLNDVVEVTGLSKTNEADRRAIGRSFKDLVDRELITAKGAARARTYSKNIETYLLSPLTTNDVFREIHLSSDSKKLLQYLSKETGARKPVGYDENFLRLYIPNKTFYLSKIQRDELLKIGKVEDINRTAGTYARNILNRLLIDLSWNSSRLEGNTYSLLETKRLLESGESATGRNAAETQMILNHKEAIEFIVNSTEENNTSSQVVRSVHALLSENLLGDSSASGRIRQIAVGIANTTYLPLDNPHILAECFQLFIDKLNRIQDPFEQSFFSLVHLSYLQAFEDVNKRTARLVANIPLIKKNLRPLSFIDVDQVAYVKSLIGIYEKNDVSLLGDLYMWAYDRSSQKYSAIQQSMGKPNLLKMKYRTVIHDIVRKIILEKISGDKLIFCIQDILKKNNLPEKEIKELFKLIEVEIINLHDGNIARYQIRPSEFDVWKKLN